NPTLSRRARAPRPPPPNPQRQGGDPMSKSRRLRVLLGAVTGAAILATSLSACSDDAGEGGGDGLIVVGFVAVGPEGAWREANERNVQDTFTEEAGFDLRYAPATNLDQQSQIAAF